MNTSTLLQSLIRGKWFMSVTEAMAKDAIVAKLFSGEFKGESLITKILSETSPIQILLDSGKSCSYSGSSTFDDAPADSSARIAIRGTMLKYGTWCSYGTIEIAEAIRCAADHPNIGSIILDIDSGGGQCGALAPITEAILYARKKKPCVAVVDICASLAYYTAIFCDEIISNNDISSEIGSIGVMICFQDMQEYYKKFGIITHTIYSNLSDYKNRPFELARENKYDEIKAEELDPLALKFQNDVKMYRGDKLNQEIPGILQGRMFYAPQALEYGLIDHIGDSDFVMQRVRELQLNRDIKSYINNK